MILADKIIKERKKLGLSQEELAEKMNVSRQAVSKWEGNQSVPEIEKILQLSSLFGVTTDYLLKDEIESEGSTGKEEKQCDTVKETFSQESLTQGTPAVVAEKSGIFPFNNKTVSIGTSNDGVSENKGNRAVRTVTMKQAEDYLSIRKAAAKNIAIGTFLCIISVIPLLLLAVINESGVTELSENMAGALGLILMLIIVAPAAGLFIYAGFKSASYEFLEKEPFETENGVTEMVKQQQETFSGTFAKFNIIGTIFCILSPISLFIGAFSDIAFSMIIALAIMMVIVGIGVIFFILAGVPHESMQKLLKEGDYSEEAKKSKGIKGAVAIVYWLVVTAVYLLMVFLSKEQGGNWRSGISWVIWPVAGVLFPAVMTLCGVLEKKSKSKSE